MIRQSIAKQMKKEFKRLEKHFYLKALKMADGRPEVSAQILGVSRSQFFKKVKQLDIKYSKKWAVTYSLDAK